ncbi:MAG: OsmC family protein [Longimicrobiales bacterium]|nr:OsmC family protein [Longimicrobiales bacterium]
MSVRTASAEWKGDLKGGTGTVSTETGTVDASYSFPSRFEEGEGTNPEELIGAALAGCYAMALSNILDEAGHTPDRVAATVRVHLEVDDEGPSVTQLEIDCEAQVPGIDDETFQQHANEAKEGCPISKAIAAPISLEARLTEGAGI